MAGYRLFCLDEGGHIVDRHDFDAEDDAAAIALAQATWSDTDCEIWELGRRVATIPALKNTG